MTISDIVKYFQAEKNESLIFVLIGVIAIVVSCYGLFVMRTDFFKGLAYPLLAVAFSWWLAVVCTFVHRAILKG